jgi:hypothetical protein
MNAELIVLTLALQRSQPSADSQPQRRYEVHSPGTAAAQYASAAGTQGQICSTAAQQTSVYKSVL